MFSNDRSELRKFYKTSWLKHKNTEPMTDLEKQVACIILEHPEYHAFFDKFDPESDDQEFFAQTGDINPFLHLGLHLGIRDQIAINQPDGVRNIHTKLCDKLQNHHDAEHKMIEILAEQMYQTQKNQTEFDTIAYMRQLKDTVI